MLLKGQPLIGRVKVVKGSRALIALASRQDLELPNREMTPIQGLSDAAKQAPLPQRDATTSVVPTARDCAAAWWLLMSEEPDCQDSERLPRLSVADLADLLFAEVGLNELGSVWRWLHGSQLWFRLRRDRDVQTRSREEIRRQRQARRRDRQLAWREEQQIALLLRAAPLTSDERSTLSRTWTERIEQLLDFACDETLSLVSVPELDNTLRLLSISPERSEVRTWLITRQLLDPDQPRALRGSVWSGGFTQDQLDAAEQLIARADQPCPGDEYRADLTALTTYTVDDITTREIDDGLSLEPKPDGDWIWIHIADPARLIAPDSPLDREARRRATSLYLADGCQPMLPMQLAADVLSLRSGQRCPALSVGVLLEPEGSIAQHRITRSWVQPRYRLNYEDADELIELAPPGDEDLARMASLLQQRARWRLEQGAVSFDRPEGRFRRNDGQLELQLIDFSASRQMVSEAMVLMGAVVAGIGRDYQLPLPFRSQVRAELPTKAELEQIPDGPARDAAVQRCLSRGVQGTTPLPHFSLGLEAYVQATSPIRRYSDLLVHRQLIANLDQQEPLTNDHLVDVINELDNPMRQAIQISREDQRHWQRIWFAGHAGQVWSMQFLRWLRQQDRLALLHVNDLAMGIVGRLELEDPLPGQALQCEVVVPEDNESTMLIR